MRDYGKLFCAFWTSETVQSFTDDAKLLAAYLLTNQHCTLIGCYRLTNGYVADDLCWTDERVTKGFAELFAKGFATRCEASKWVLIHKYLEWNPLENPNQHKAAQKMFEKLPDSVSVKGALATILNIADWKPLANPSATVPKPVAVAVTVEGTGVPGADRADSPVRSKKITFKTFLDNCEAKGEKAISDYRPVIEYRDKLGLPEEWIYLCWRVFHRKYLDDKKTYVDWRKTFLNCVQDNWYRLWTFSTAGEPQMTAAGFAEKKITSIDERAAAA